MIQPDVQPASLSVQVVPGGSKDATVTFLAPSDAQVTASIAGGDSLVALQAVTATAYVWRDATPDEEKQHPLLGPAGKNSPVRRILVPEEIGTTDGATPLQVRQASSVQVSIRLTVAASQPESIAAASLTINGTGWLAVTVPITVIIGPADTPVTFVPAAIRVAAKPGETTLSGTMLDGASVAAKALVHVANDDGIVRIRSVIAYLPERRMPTDEELALMPVAQRATARAQGITQYREVARGDGRTPFDVPLNGRVTINIDFVAPAIDPPDKVTNKLIVEGTTWQRVEIPLDLAIGLVTVTVSPDALSVRQGDSAVIEAQIKSVVGPDTNVSFALDQAGLGTITPALINVSKGAGVTANLTVSVDPGAPTGTYPAGLDVRSFADTQLQTIPFDLAILPAAILLIPLQQYLSVLQGDRGYCKVEVISAGGYKKLTFSAGTMPPGVTLIAPVWENYGAATTVLTLEFAVDVDADYAEKALASINWSAGDGVQQGRLDFYLSVLLIPASKTFSDIVTTPEGTALGGQVEMTVRNDGTANFKGEMHDSGFLSYKFSVRALVVSANGLIGVVAQKSGEVEGTEAGLNPQRTFSWDEPVITPSKFTRDLWKSVRTSNMTVSKAYEISGVVGTLADLVADVLDFLIAVAVLAPASGGAGLACLLMIGSELGKLYGARVTGPGGLVGVVFAAGAAFLVGPLMIIPAFVVGAIVGELGFKSRTLTEVESTLARTVFGDTLPLDSIVVTNLIGLADKTFTVPNVDGRILLNMGGGHDESLDQWVYRKYQKPGELFIHELTHAWQITYSPFVHDYFWKGAIAKLAGSSAYQYGPAGPAWGDFGIEQQASIVNEWFAGTTTYMNPQIPNRQTSDPNDPYHEYIQQNILLGKWS